MLKFLLGILIGWSACNVYTYQYVSHECQKLGGFFVGTKTFKCSIDDNVKKD
jgi:hypothetical protein